MFVLFIACLFVRIAIDCFIMLKYPSISFPHSPHQSPPLSTRSLPWFVCICVGLLSGLPLFIFISIFFFFLCLFPALFPFLFGYSKSHSFCPYFIRASTNPDPVSVATNTPGATGNQSLQPVAAFNRPSYRGFKVLVRESLDTLEYFSNRC